MPSEYYGRDCNHVDDVCRGYLLTQVLGGVWADKFGGKRVLSFGVIWWSMATALTPLAASLGFPVLLAMRACMGVGEGVAMPAMNNLLSRYSQKQPGYISRICCLSHYVSEDRRVCAADDLGLHGGG